MTTKHIAGADEVLKAGDVIALGGFQIKRVIKDGFIATSYDWAAEYKLVYKNGYLFSMTLADKGDKV